MSIKGMLDGFNQVSQVFNKFNFTPDVNNINIDIDISSEDHPFKGSEQLQKELLEKYERLQEK